MNDKFDTAKTVVLIDPRNRDWIESDRFTGKVIHPNEAVLNSISSRIRGHELANGWKMILLIYLPLSVTFTLLGIIGIGVFSVGFLSSLLNLDTSVDTLPKIEESIVIFFGFISSLIGTCISFTIFRNIIASMIDKMIVIREVKKLLNQGKIVNGSIISIENILVRNKYRTKINYQIVGNQNDKKYSYNVTPIRDNKETEYDIGDSLLILYLNNDLNIPL